MKIGVVGLYSNKNVGDYLLVDCAKLIVKNHSLDTTIKVVDVDPRDSKVFSGKRKINYIVSNLLDRYSGVLFSRVKVSAIRYYYEYISSWIRLNWYYRSSFNDLDCIVIAGGGFIKFKTQGLNYLMEQIIKIAEKKEIPIMFNAVGIEGYSENDIRCQKLKKAINSDTVKTITARDDIDTLQKQYITNEKIVTDLVGDPVFLLKECLSVEKKPGAKKIGISLVNPNNFKRYGGKISKFSVENFYKNLVQELNIRGVDYNLFSNGMVVDHVFGERLVSDMNLPKNILLNRPEDSMELIEMISNFKIILAGRMHAGIVAYALDIPKVGLIWSGKIDFFANIIEERETYFNEKELDYKKIADLLCDDTKKKVNTKPRDALKEKSLFYINSFLDNVERGKYKNES